ncbi:MAG: carboxypeptidase regulatory-like domain-containing protein [Candidatus Brocadiaceae bacterium]|nr:carboxypeptidase regulatory-like domain-containing protein [Candidatus Brocadiaceae bacterium]
MKNLKFVAVTGLLAFGAFCISQGESAKGAAPAYKVVEVKGGGSIAGTVKFEGAIPKPKMLKVNKDQKTCGHGQKESEQLVVNGESMGIKDVVVSLEGITEGKAPAEGAPALDQKGCVFIPHVLAVSAGSEVELLNSDNVMHNLHSWSIRNPAFNEGVSGNGSMTKKFELPELVKITCDVHKWMSSFVVVKENPYFAVSDENGMFKIDNIPAGTYKVEAWQEKLGKRKSDVTVKSGEETVVDFVFKKK